MRLMARETHPLGFMEAFLFEAEGSPDYLLSGRTRCFNFGLSLLALSSDEGYRVEPGRQVR